MSFSLQHLSTISADDFVTLPQILWYCPLYLYVFAHSFLMPFDQATFLYPCSHTSTHFVWILKIYEILNDDYSKIKLNIWKRGPGRSQVDALTNSNRSSEVLSRHQVCRYRIDKKYMLQFSIHCLPFTWSTSIQWLVRARARPLHYFFCTPPHTL